MAAVCELSSDASLRTGRIFGWALAAVGAIKITLLILDPAPNFYMGDSAAFIGTALTEWFPPQRSWTYGFFIRWFCLPLQSLTPLILVQTFGGIITSAALGWCLIQYFGISSTIAAGMMVASAFDPLQLLYERMVMPETMSLSLLALLVIGILDYRRNSRLSTLVLVQLLFAGLISLRLQFLIPLGPFVLLLPFVGKHMRNRPIRAAWHAFVGFVVLCLLHGAYREAMGIKHRQPPAYSYGTKLMVLSAMTPQLIAEDANDVALFNAISKDAAFPLQDRMLRNEQMWRPGGLVDRMCTVLGDEYQADEAAGKIVVRMLRRDPVGLFLCGLHNYADFWDLTRLAGFLQQDRDSGSFDTTFTGQMAESFHLDLSDYPRPTLTKWLHARSVPWVLLLLLSPLVLFVAALNLSAEFRGNGWLIFGLATVILAQNTILSCMPVYRYLLPQTFFTLLAVGIISDRCGRRR